VALEAGRQALVSVETLGERPLALVIADGLTLQPAVGHVAEAVGDVGMSRRSGFDIPLAA